MPKVEDTEPVGWIYFQIAFRKQLAEIDCKKLFTCELVMLYVHLESGLNRDG